MTLAAVTKPGPEWPDQTWLHLQQNCGALTRLRFRKICDNLFNLRLNSDPTFRADFNPLKIPL
jgi:hypothetical protein